MKSSLIIDVYKSLENLNQARDRLNDAMAMENLCYHVMPHMPDADRSDAINALTRIHKHADLPPEEQAGFIQIHPDTAPLVHALNNAKSQFQKAVLNFSKYNNPSKKRIDVLIDRALKQDYMDPVSNETLGKENIRNIDRNRAYAEIKIFEIPVLSFSWTWEKKPMDDSVITREEALAMANELPNPDHAILAREKLQSISDEKLAIVKHRPARLLCNYRYHDLPGEKPISKNIKGDKIFVVTQPVAPEYVWRKNPDKHPELYTRSLTRSDKRINPEPFILALNLHRYL